MTADEARRTVRALSFVFGRAAVTAIVAGVFAVAGKLCSLAVAAIVVGVYLAGAAIIWSVLRRRTYARVAR